MNIMNVLCDGLIIFLRGSNNFLIYFCFIKACKTMFNCRKNDILNVGSFSIVLIYRECIGPTGLPGMFLGNVSS
jgi:hypothetical protein